MVSISVMLKNKVGLHARPAALFVQTAKKFKSNIRVIKGDLEADAKSILEILSLGAEQGDEIIIEAVGEDEKDALKTLVDLVNNKFGEE
jgi:phosphocarrier protein